MSGLRPYPRAVDTDVLAKALSLLKQGLGQLWSFLAEFSVSFRTSTTLDVPLDVTRDLGPPHCTCHGLSDSVHTLVASGDMSMVRVE